MPTVWFIRHAESESNAGLPTIDPEGVSLTPRGFEQAKYIAQTFDRPPRLIVTSPYIRTKQTALPTMQRFPESHQDEWPVHEFTYLSLPEYRYTTRYQRIPGVRAFWRRLDPSYVDGEGAESFYDFMTRVQYIIHQLNSFNNDLIAIFSHEQFIRATAWTLFIGPERAQEALKSSDSMLHFRHFLRSFVMPNGSILKVQLRAGEDPWFSPIITSHLPDRERTLVTV